MRVNDNHLPAETYALIQRHVPEACVELFLEHDGGVLLARRANEPAKGEWFWPGSRLYKGETLEDAARRVAREELGIAVELTGRLGVYSHFWDTSSVDGVDARHTVNVVFRARPVEDEFKVRLDDQHDAFRFVREGMNDCHRYVSRYLRDAGWR